MSPNVSLPAFGALLLAAAAFGVHLGQTTIDGINPIHFQGPAVHPRDRGAVAHDAIEAAQPIFSQLYGWEEGAEARSLDCGGCEALGARDAYAGGGRLVHAVMETGWSDPQAEPAAYRYEPEADSYFDEGYVEAEPSQLDRYAAFAIEEKGEPALFAAFQE